VACHNQGGVGGGGDNSHNVRAFEVLPTRASPEVKGGVVHKFATDPSLKESEAEVHRLFPMLKGHTAPPPPNTCNPPINIPDFEPVVFEEVSSTALFGEGWIDCIPEKAITHNRTRRLVAGAAKEMAADFSDTPVGRVRQLAGGRVGKFGWKGQAATLEEF